MGFGLLALGYIFLNFYTVGADLVGYVIMLIALNKLSKIEKSFKKSLIAVIILIPVGLFNLFGFVDTVFEFGFFRNYDYTEQSVSVEASTESVDASIENVLTSSDLSEVESLSEDTAATEKNNTKRSIARILEGVFNAVFVFGSLCFHYLFYKSAHALCMRTDAIKMGIKAQRNMAINILFFSVWGLLSAGSASMGAFVMTLLHFVVLLLNFVYIYSCYATFSFEGDSAGECNDE